MGQSLPYFIRIVVLKNPDDGQSYALVSPVFGIAHRVAAG